MGIQAYIWKLGHLRWKQNLKLLNALKSGRPDNLRFGVLNELAHERAGLKGAIFNKFLKLDVAPYDWRRVKVVPTFKKGKK